MGIKISNHKKITICCLFIFNINFGYASDSAGDCSKEGWLCKDIYLSIEDKLGGVIKGFSSPAVKSREIEFIAPIRIPNYATDQKSFFSDLSINGFFTSNSGKRLSLLDFYSYFSESAKVNETLGIDDILKDDRKFYSKNGKLTTEYKAYKKYEDKNIKLEGRLIKASNEQKKEDIERDILANNQDWEVFGYKFELIPTIQQAIMKVGLSPKSNFGSWIESLKELTNEPRNVNDKLIRRVFSRDWIEIFRQSPSLESLTFSIDGSKGKSEVSGISSISFDTKFILLHDPIWEHGFLQSNQWEVKKDPSGKLLNKKESIVKTKQSGLIVVKDIEIELLEEGRYLEAKAISGFQLSHGNSSGSSLIAQDGFIKIPSYYVVGIVSDLVDLSGLGE